LTRTGRWHSLPSTIVQGTRPSRHSAPAGNLCSPLRALE
jgi:hypothetical protein